jgi:hypothetical protein
MMQIVFVERQTALTAEVQMPRITMIMKAVQLQVAVMQISSEMGAPL